MRTEEGRGKGGRRVPFLFLSYAWNALLLRKIGSKFRSLELELCDAFNGSRAAATAAAAIGSVTRTYMMHVCTHRAPRQARRGSHQSHSRQSSTTPKYTQHTCPRKKVLVNPSVRVTPKYPQASNLRGHIPLVQTSFGRIFDT